MKRLLLASVLALAPAVASAEPFQFLSESLGGRGGPSLNLSCLPGGRGVFGAVQVPPTEFDRPAKREVVTYLPWQQAVEVCRSLTSGSFQMWPYSCAVVPQKTSDKCFIFLPLDQGEAQDRNLLSHERGHCNSGSDAHFGYYYAQPW